MKRTQNYFRGCLLGGAIGDAYGAPTKLMKHELIAHYYSENSLSQFIGEKEKATITDDTQLTVFTAEGLIRSRVRAEQKKIALTKRDTSVLVFRAYLRWLYTQGLRTPNWKDSSYDGWLVKLKKFHGYKDPGLTCITALGKGIMGTPHKPINQSRRCGTVIRIAPVGLITPEEDAFEVGKLIGAITHGHPEAYLSAAACASIISYIMGGCELEEAITKTLAKLRGEENAATCIEAIEKALTLYQKGEATREDLESFGDGYMAKDALGMALYCALHYRQDIEKGILFAINQSGNSNTIASIYGNIIGASIGEEQIPKHLLDKLEMLDEIRQLADDLLVENQYDEAFLERYPGW